MRHQYFNVGNSCANFPIIHRAVDAANDLVNDQKFIDAIRNKTSGKFYLADCTPTIVANEIAKFRRTMTVEIWYPKWKYSTAIAMFDSATPYKIYLNGYKLKRSLGEVGASCVHELVHAVDFTSNYYFGHLDNKWTKAKEDSAPYWIDNLTEAMIDSKPMSTVKPGKNRHIKTRYFSIWKPWTWFNKYK